MDELEQQLAALRDSGVSKEEAKEVLFLTTRKNPSDAVPTRYWGVNQLLYRMSLKVLNEVYANADHHCGG